jgi:tetratricopeptide (TPR) repeat protein
MLADPSLEPLTALVGALKEAWRDGAAPDAPGAIREHPALLRHRSLVVDLAYEEYCLREEAGAAPEPEVFCARFAAFRSQIHEVIRGHRLLADHPELLAAPPAWPLPGGRFEQLLVERELGRGAFARVYLARDPEAGDRPVVLKLSPGPSREARTLGPITHPHVVPVLWARRSGGFDAVCMPFVGATTLGDAVAAAFVTAGGAEPGYPRRRDRGYPRWAATVAARLAAAVEYLHRAGVAHGDLKPSNVLLGPGAHPYLIDFNLATGLTDPPLRCGGTLPYMPPERLRAMIGETSGPTSPAAADVYSFGVVLFETLTGRVPVEPNDGPASAAVAALLERLAARRTARAAGAPAALAAIVDRCLAPDPAARPTMSQVRRELERYLARRRFGRVVGVGLAAAVGLSLLVAHPTPPGRSIDEPPPPIPSPPAPRPNSAGAHFAEGVRHLKRGQVAAALADFDAADRLRPDGPTAAHLGYCQSLAGQHRAAVELYQRAIRDHRFAPAWVRNNLAYGLIKSAPTAGSFRTARAEADAALALSAGLRPARLNRVYAQFRLELKEGKQDLTDAAALAEVDAVMAEPSGSADLYAKAAAMTVAFGNGRPDCAGRAIGYLERAVELGHRPTAFASDPVLSRYLADRADYRRVLERLPGVVPGPVPDPHLVRPPLD